MDSRERTKDLFVADWFADWGHLGARSYFCHQRSSSACYRGFAEATSRVPPESRFLDPAAVLSVLMKNYIIGDRTVVAEVRRTPWMAKPDGSGGWAIARPPSHGSEIASARDVAGKLGALLSQEARKFLDGKSTLGLLLSGGMDSRIVAGIVRLAQQRKEYNGDVVALSWGVENCRDVQYARRIASTFGWEFIHLPLNSELLADNVLLAGALGAEMSPIHLHAIPLVARQGSLDGILAGSYGDSVGRGEYSGTRVARLPSLLSRHHNHFGFLRLATERWARAALLRDCLDARQAFPQSSEVAFRELELQMHYMRRQLNGCFDVIDNVVPVYQMFTSPAVVAEMWRLTPRCRSDEVYVHLLRSLPGDLLQIPWARTGRIFGSRGRPIDSLLSKSNHYGKWLRNDCRELILNLISNGALSEMEIFDDRALAWWSRWWSRGTASRPNRLDEKMAWLASLSVAISRYGLRKPQLGDADEGMQGLRRWKGRLLGIGYQWLVEQRK